MATEGVILGRPIKIDGASYLQAIRKARSTDDQAIAKIMGLDRSTVYRFKRKYPDVLKEAEAIIDEIVNIKISDKLDKELFMNIPSIGEWVLNMEKQRISKTTINKYIVCMLNICKHLKIHPDKLTVQQLSELTLKMKGVKNSDLGFSWAGMRKPIRSYFSIIKGISKDLLKSLGIDCSDTEGTGTYAHQRVTKEQRANFEKTLRVAIDECIVKLSPYYPLKNEIYLEILYWCKFMYYTATRREASLGLILNNEENIYDKDVWIFSIFDKGKKDKPIKWEKILTDFALEDFRGYLEKRFGLDYMKVEKVFPIISKMKETFINPIMIKALEYAGKKTGIPAHIWRHTFAQDALDATDSNFELVASLGGWVNINVLIRHYGKRSKQSKIKGLRKAMGLPIVEEKIELRW